MDTTALLTVRELRVRAVHVPMPLPLRTSSGTIQIAPLALIDLLTEQGVTGHTYLFCYTPLVLKPVVQLLENLSPLIQGDPVAPLALERKLQGMFRLLGLKGVTGMALAGIDMAAWDAQARSQGLPLARLLGADRDRVPAYNSCGLGIIGSHDAPAEAEHLLVHGFEAIKVRLGYVEARTDVEVVWAVRRAIGEEVALMADYNQILSVAEAVRRTDMLQDEDLHWVEEPTLADDFSGHAQIRSRTRIPVQMGENWWGTHDMAKSLAAGASDLGMPDAMKIGGVSGWLRAAALAEAAGMPVSSHLFPEVSAHLLAATPTAHWLEYVDWANPVLRSPLRIELGQAVVSDRPGTGIEWDEDAVAQYLAN
ncbi:mandelate racemase [Hydrogenophaga aromaticivorans]|uniref:enolase C-terminal domain-like protein n=1 Tax=Hydrogenophaga aromaticivorans TaxID=2610898 RepID=UPI001B38C269|nr:enolase C-terminal domain-like protein [Hydrogenophaga aromaticivorans]MBQ0920962.1 mandelate racemase [Hydrogenophaga aromaticivorans]